MPLNLDQDGSRQKQQAEERTKQEAARVAWVEDTYDKMSWDERIGQLFMIRAHSNLGSEHVAHVERMIKEYHVGGLCFFQGTPEEQVRLTNKYQSLARKVPLMISMDAEWGLGMRLKKNAISFPKQLGLGAIQEEHLIYEMGAEVAYQLRRVGVHVNFAPVVDVNNNPKNPVINTRSFGENRENVSRKGMEYVRGMQDNGVMACAKHFPGHGDTDVDSHLDLPIIPHDSDRLDSIEMYPFRMLAYQGVQSMMVAHLFVPTIDNTKNTPTTLSKKAVTDILRYEIGFDGLVFTDGLGMKGVTKHHQPGALEVKALKVGNDVLLLPEDTPKAFKAIKRAIGKGTLDSLQVERSVKRVLHAKNQLGLTQPQYINPINVRKDINRVEAKILNKKLAENTLTLVRNNDQILPVRDLANVKYASLSIGSNTTTTFQQRLEKYTRIRHFNADKKPSASKQAQLLKDLKRYDVVFVSLHDMSSYASKNFGLNTNLIRFLKKVNEQNKIVLTVFGNPYSLKHFDEFGNVLVAYQEEDDFQMAAAQGIFGAQAISGKLPVSASALSRFGDGVYSENLLRLRYDVPESVGMSSDTLKQLDSLAEAAIGMKATPGCQIMVVKNGTVVFDKAYGYHTYAKRRKVSTEDLYDIASITKVAATTISLMKLYEQGQIGIFDSLGTHLSFTNGTNKGPLQIYDVLAHHAGLKPWIPFYKETVTDNRRNPQPLPKWYKRSKSGAYAAMVTDRLFMRMDYQDSIWNKITDSELRNRTDYKYSDLGFIMFSKLVDEVSKTPLDEYANTHFYGPLGLKATTYNPLNRYSKSMIVPSEEDNYFRRQKIQGTVHDMGAAMLGGVSGHAGLFSNTNDLAILFQMLLNKGYYGGQHYLSESTVNLFRTRHNACTRRGLGFDLFELDNGRKPNFCDVASPNTYGHLGFTGTSIWADPDNDLIFIFLSNRTYPSMNNWKLNKENFRPKMQEVAYKAMKY